MRLSLDTLDVFKNEIVHKSGPTIKANYLKRLFFWVLCISVVITGISYLGNRLTSKEDGSSAEIAEAAPEVEAVKATGDLESPGDGKVSFWHTGLLLAVSMWGLFFASCTRNITPSFDTLVIPDADLMHPWVKLVFYGLGIFALSLIFQLELITVAFGNVFSTSQISRSISIAILSGLLLGIAERAVPQEVSRWAAKLVSKAGPQEP